MNVKILLTPSLFLLTLGSTAVASPQKMIHAQGKVTLVHGSLDIENGSQSASAISDGINLQADYGQVFTVASLPTPDYFERFPEGLVFDMDLGQAHDLQGISFWNRNDINGNAATAFNVIFSNDSKFGNSDDTQAFKFTLKNQGGAQQIFKLPKVITQVQFARISITDNAHNPTVMKGGDRIGFSEIQFHPPVVSPSSLVQVRGVTLSITK